MRLSFIILVLFCLIVQLKGQGSNDSIAYNLLLEDLVVTAQYAPTHISNVEYEVRVIKEDEIRKQGFNNLAEVLTNQLNLRVQADPILGNGLKIQGIGGENVQIMIDGVPVIGRLGGNIDLSQIQLSQIVRIEIVEGALSAQYGSNATGGVINIITRKAQPKRLRFESQNQYETIGILNNALSLGWQTKKLYLSLGLSRIHSQFAEYDSLRLFQLQTLPSGGTVKSKVNPWNPKLQLGLNGGIGYRFSDSLKVNYQYSYFDELVSSLGERRRPQFKPYAFDEFYTTIRQDHNLSVEGYIGKGGYLNSITAYNQYDRIKKTTRVDFENDSVSLVEGGQDSSKFTALLHRTSFSQKLSQQFQLISGLEFYHETGWGKRIVDSSSHPVNETELTNYAVWAGLRFQPLERLTLSANLRYGYNSKFTHPLIPAFHISWMPLSELGVKFSYAHGFRAPSLKELHFNFIDVNHYIVGNPKLKVENAKNVKLSIQFTKKLAAKHQFSLGVKLFYNEIKNRIVLATFEPLKFNYQNIDQFKNHGLNIQFSYNWKDIQLKSGFAYSRQLNELANSFEVPDYTGQKEWQNEVRCLIPFVKTNFIFTHRYIGRQLQFFTVDDSLEERFVGAYQLLNVNLSRSFWQDRFFLAIGVKNITDMKQVASNSGMGSTHGSFGDSQLISWGRTFFVRLNLVIQ